MEVSQPPERCLGLPPLVGTRLVIVSNGLERGYDRARGLDDLGYRVAASGDIRSAPEFVGEFQPDAVVVDLGRDQQVPDTVLRIRTATNVPILVVGSTGSSQELLRCLESGADEYCRPPAPTDEIDLRLRALFRRVRVASSGASPRVSEAVVRVGDLEIDHASQTVRKRGALVPLSPTEFRLLVTLAERQGEVVPSKALIARVWGNQYSTETHYLRLYVRYLRQKLEDDPSHPRYIVNRWGSGYALEGPALAA
jgi:two-component system KDP operon response regulator KdpE